MNARNDTTARGSVKGGYLHWQHLQAELLCLDLLIRREVRRWVLAGQDPNDDYRGLYVTQTEAEQLLDRPFGVSWGQMIPLPPAEEDAFDQALAQARQQAAECAEQMASQGQTSRLLQLATAFDLDRTALDILLLCLAPALDTKYERLYGYLQDNVMRRRPTVRLVLDLLGEPGVEKFALAMYLNADAPLFQHRLLEYIVESPPVNAHWLNQTLQPSETMVAWLRGPYEPQGTLAHHAKLESVANQRAHSLLAGDFGQAVAMISTLEQPPVVVFYGVDQLGQAAAAQLLALQTKSPLLTVNVAQVISEEQPAQTVVREALRDARLTGAIPYLAGWDACLDKEQRLAAELLKSICSFPQTVILAGQVRWHPVGIKRLRPMIWHEFREPTYAQRQALWLHFVEEATAATNDVAEKAISHLAGQFVLTSSQIRDAVLAATDHAVQAQRLLCIDDLFVAARDYSNPRLSTLARKITPRYGWDDIVLPDDQAMILREVVATVRQRPKVLEEWGVGKKLAASAGVTMLFAGPPGTGKTMAAEVIAHDLRLDLYKIDLSSVVSKYIGETEKNLERIFTEASNSNAILFFDEADAIFGKRSEVKDAHDRYANVEVSYLLQRMEAYDGVTILATNLRANLDEAFTRRIHFVVDFPFPRMEDRLHIWKTLFPSSLPRDEAVDFTILARRFELAGGNIRNIIVSAAYLAADNGQVVSMAHLLHGAKRELQKMGRWAGNEEFEY